LVDSTVLVALIGAIATIATALIAAVVTLSGKGRDAAILEALTVLADENRHLREDTQPEDEPNAPTPVRRRRHAPHT
jgi:hypothetical protein